MNLEQGSIKSGVTVDVTPALPLADDYLPVRLTDGSSFLTVVGGALSVTSEAVTPVYSYAEDTAVVSTTETTVLTYTVPATKTINIQGFSCTGTATGRFKLKVAGTTKSVLRTSAASRSERVYWGKGVIQATAGIAVIITAYHEEIPNQTMEVALYGYLT
jgi:hypothetical protein